MAGVVESVKAAADIYMPVSGEVVEVNEALRADPSLANSDPLGNGWFFKVHVTDMAEFDQLMDRARVRRAAEERSEPVARNRLAIATMLMSARQAARRTRERRPNSSPATSASSRTKSAACSAAIGAASRAGADRRDRAARDRAQRADGAAGAAAGEAQALAELQRASRRRTRC